VKRDTIDKGKFKKLCLRLGIPAYAAVGLLELLWRNCAIETPRGDIGRQTNEDIALCLSWEGDHDKLVDALVECRWLDEHPEHRLIVHDWHDHCPDWVDTALFRAGDYFASGHRPKGSKCGKAERDQRNAQYDEKESAPIGTQKAQTAPEMSQQVPQAPAQVQTGPEEPQRVPAGPGGSQRLPNPKPLTSNHKPSNPNSKVAQGEGSGGRETAEPTPPPEPAWWMLEPDSWECELAETVRGSRGYGSFTPDEKRLRALIARVKGFCPDRESFTEVLAGWVDRSAKKVRPEYSDPILALGKWFGMREAEWRKVKRNRQIDEERAAKGQSGYTPSRFAGMSAEERLRALEAEDGAA